MGWAKKTRRNRNPTSSSFDCKQLQKEDENPRKQSKEAWWTSSLLYRMCFYLFRVSLRVLVQQGTSSLRYFPFTFSRCGVPFIPAQFMRRLINPLVSLGYQPLRVYHRQPDLTHKHMGYGSELLGYTLLHNRGAPNPINTNQSAL